MVHAIASGLKEIERAALLRTRAAGCKGGECALTPAADLSSELRDSSNVVKILLRVPRCELASQFRS